MFFVCFRFNPCIFDSFVLHYQFMLFFSQSIFLCEIEEITVKFHLLCILFTFASRLYFTLRFHYWLPLTRFIFVIAFYRIVLQVSFYSVPSHCHCPCVFLAPSHIQPISSVSLFSFCISGMPATRARSFYFIYFLLSSCFCLEIMHLDLPVSMQ